MVPLGCAKRGELAGALRSPPRLRLIFGRHSGDLLEAADHFLQYLRDQGDQAV